MYVELYLVETAAKFTLQIGFEVIIIKFWLFQAPPGDVGVEEPGGLSLQKVDKDGSSNL